MKKLTSTILALIMIVAALVSAIPAGGEEISFSDVSADRWSFEYVKYAAEHGLMNGVGGGRFDPAGTMTRSMVVTVLWRREGSIAIGYSPVFKDVADNEWYTSAVLWAKNCGVVNGTSKTTFSPKDRITREQLATMLFRYAEFKGYDVSASGDLSGFPDASAVSDWARSSVVWATDKGLINGIRKGSKDYLDPPGNATREQFAAVIARFCGLFESSRIALKEDPLSEAAENIGSVLCKDHGALHAEFGAPETLNEQTLSNLFVSALGLDISIYRALFREDELTSLISGYRGLALGEKISQTVHVSFINDRLFEEDWRKSETEEKEAVLILRRGYSTLSPKLIGCPEIPMRDEEIDCALAEIGSLLCADHNVLHAVGTSFSESDVENAVLGLIGAAPSGYSVRIDPSSLDAMSAGADPADLTFSVTSKALEGVENAKAESDPVTVKVSVIGNGDGFAFVDCPLRSEKALDRFEEKYLCADHGKLNVSLLSSGDADAELTALIGSSLDLGDGYKVTAALDGETVTVTAERNDGFDRATKEYAANTVYGDATRFVLCDCDRDAYQFIYQTAYYGWGSSGWSYDLTANAGREPGKINDTVTDDSSALIRDINVTAKGILTFRTGVTFTSGFDGAVIALKNSDGDPVFVLETSGGAWCVRGADGSLTALLPGGGESYFRFEITVDLYEETASVGINGTDCGTFGLLTKGVSANIRTFLLGSTDEGTVSYVPTLSNAEANYSIYEQFAEENPVGSVPFGWETSGAYCDSGANICDGAIGDRWDGSMGLYRWLRIGAYGSAERTSYEVDGSFNAEFTILPDLSGTDFAFVLKNGGDDVLNISFDDDTIRLNGQEVYEYVKNVPYDIRLQVIGDGTGAVWINGIKRATAPLAANLSADAVAFRNYSSGDVWIDNVYLYETYEHPDYVPVPVPPEGADEYTLGINVCNLWYTGDHMGWDCITPHKDIKPVLGYYDEGSPEVADWEIKYMVEHGIDFQAVCFYAQENNAPITTRHGYQLDRGYKYAKYSDMMKYCLIWESANALYPLDMNAWRTYYVPYFIEHYFKDPRYMTIENKPLLGSFGGFMYDRENWDDEKFREAQDYLNEEVRKLGFDGVLWVGDHGDGFFSYNLGRGSYDPEEVKLTTEITVARAKERGETYVPTVGMGANVVGWDEGRTPLSTVEQFRTTNEWMRDVWLKEHPAEKSWLENFVWVATWNEYGEGHYIMPAEELVGFGYLDVLRDVYTKGGIDPSLNVVPDEHQLKRLGHQYPQDRMFLYPDGFAEFSNGADDPVLFPARNEEDHVPVLLKLDLGRDYFNADSAISFEDGKICNNSDKQAKVCFRLPDELTGKKYSRIVFNARLDDDMQFTMEYGTMTDSGLKRTRISIDDNTKPWDKEYYIDIPSEKLTGDTVRVTLPPHTYLSAADVRLLPESGEMYPYSIRFAGKDLIVRVPIEISPAGDVLTGYFQMSIYDGQGIGMFDDYSVWDPETGRLTLKWQGKKTMEFTVGSNFYYDGGVRKYLGYELYAVDGVPMIPLNIIAEGLGLTLSFSEHRYIDVR
ncbi:MAG: S-layer homology domain-containing protein [Clostridia bacterium]|nr:S-layer homology domain-containing protein [Clostridia bacterium]